MVYSEAVAQRIRRSLGARREIAEKEMFGGIAFLLHGNLCVGVHGDDLIVRVEPEATDALLRERGAKIFDLSGRPMKGWLVVTPEGFRTDSALQEWIDRGVTFTASLPKKAASGGARRSGSGSRGKR